MISSNVLRAIIAKLHSGENLNYQQLNSLASAPQNDLTRAILIIGYTYTFEYERASNYVSRRPLSLNKNYINVLGDDLLFMAILLDTIYSVRQKTFNIDKFTKYFTLLKERLNAHYLYYGLVSLYVDAFLDNFPLPKKQETMRQIARNLSVEDIPQKLPVRVQTFLKYAVSEILRLQNKHHKSVEILSELPLINLRGFGLNLYEIFYNSAVAAIERYTLGSKYSDAIKLGEKVKEHVEKYKKREKDVKKFEEDILNGETESSSAAFLYYFALSKIRGGNDSENVMFGLKLFSDMRKYKNKLPNMKYKKTLGYELCLDFMLMGYPEVVTKRSADVNFLKLIRTPRLRSCPP